MTTAWNAPPNSVALERAFAGTELQAGVAVTPTFKLYGKMDLNRTRTLTSIPSYAGTRFEDYNTPVPSPWEVDGSYYQPLTYEDLALLTRYGVAGGGTGVTDGNATPGYSYTRRPHATRLSDAMTVEGGWPSMPWKGLGAFFPSFTINGDTDDAEAVWKWNSPVMAVSDDYTASTSVTATGGSATTIVKAAAGWTVNQFAGAWVYMVSGTVGNIGQFREILSNDATTLTLVDALPSAVIAADVGVIGGIFTSGVTDRITEKIAFPGTKLFIDVASAIGTTQILGRFISFSLTYDTGISTLKRFAENITNFAAKPDLGMIKVTGQIRVEFDRLDEYIQFSNITPTRVRIAQTGSVISVSPATTKLATIDLYRVFWTAFTPDERNSNKAATLGFSAYVDATEGVPLQILAKNTLPVLP